ncbi:fructose-bisphosphatase class II [Salipaludibacillus sp. CF4.18]|uniref:fructose-bisphosphatase class II n=1 Tax=Salipaludibacillus sp. CF4.18 TaxID=3373081 RepID=UPI003EE5B69C
MLNVTQKAAVAAFQSVGKDDKCEADNLATNAMRKMLNEIYIRANCYWGRGERDAIAVPQHFKIKLTYDTFLLIKQSVLKVAIIVSG